MLQDSKHSERQILARGTLVWASRLLGPAQAQAAQKALQLGACCCPLSLSKRHTGIESASSHGQAWLEMMRVAALQFSYKISRMTKYGNSLVRYGISLLGMWPGIDTGPCDCFMDILNSTVTTF